MADLTAQEIVEAALRVIGELELGENVDTDEGADGLQALRILLREWGSESLMVYYTTIDSHALSAGTESYTIGSGATIDTARPEEILEAYVRYSGIDHPVDVGGQKAYAEIAQKSIGNDFPSRLWYNPTYPTGTIYLWPPGGGTLYVHSTKPLTDPAAIGTDVALPNPYQAAAKWNLACELAPEYGREPTQFQMHRAKMTRDKIIKANMLKNVNAARVDVLIATRSFHINRG